MSYIKEKIKREDASAVIEATFIVTICIFIIFTIMYIGMYFYQENVLQSIANDVANKTARTFSYSKKDPITGFIGSRNLNDQSFNDRTYYFFGDKTGKNKSEEEEAEKLAELLEKKYRIMVGQSFDVDVNIGSAEGIFLQNNVDVTIKATYSIPLLKLFGVESGIVGEKKEYKASALCMDIMGAVSVNNVIDVFASHIANTQLAKLVQHVSKIFSSSANSLSNIGDFITAILGIEKTT